MVAASALGLLFSWTGVLVVLLSIVHVTVCLFLLAVVLLQRGKTGDVMSAFGGPTPSSYAALSTDDLLTRLTKVGAATFMATSLTLALLAARVDSSVIEDEADIDLPEAAATAPVEPATSEETPMAPAEGAATAPAPAEGEPAPADGAPAPVEPIPVEGEGGEPAPATAAPETP